MIAVVKYNAGNSSSVLNALKRIGADAILTDDERVIKSADKVIFPGVGEASSAMKYLKEHELDKTLVQLEQPFLGICLGLQLMCSHSDEGDVDMLNIYSENVLHFPIDSGDKIPHVGWNTIEPIDNRLFYKVEKGSFVYFVHSYYVPAGKYSASKTEYAGVSFSSSLCKDNFYGVQFHPEKSGAVGERILKNFVEEIR